MFLKIRIKKNERALWFRDGDLKAVLGPGSHWTWSRALRPRRERLEVIDALATRFEHVLLDVLAKEAPLRDQLEVVDLAEDERAIVWKDGRLFEVLGPGRRAYWKGLAELRVERFRVVDFRLVHPQLAAILEHRSAKQWLTTLEVEASQEGLLFRDGVLVEKLGQGLHAFWKGAGNLRLFTVDRRELVLDVAGQEIVTSDKVTLRLNLVVTFVVKDAVKAVTVVSDYSQALYRDAQLVLRGAVGTRSIDALLGNKEAVGIEIRDALASRAAEMGLELRAVGVKDLILPGDMKTLFNQVIAATKEAEANLIKRREETAAARTQANTARLLAETPGLARMKELEVLKEILAGTKLTFVLGKNDLLDQVRALTLEPPRQDDS